MVKNEKSIYDVMTDILKILKKKLTNANIPSDIVGRTVAIVFEGQGPLPDGEDRKYLMYIHRVISCIVLRCGPAAYRVDLILSPITEDGRHVRIHCIDGKWAFDEFGEKKGEEIASLNILPK